MAYQDQLARLKRSVTEWNYWRSEHPEIRPNLKRAGLSSSDFMFASLDDANLRGANLSRSCLVKADLKGSILINSNLNHANLRNADLRNAILRGADLSYADLGEADLSHSDLSNVNLNHANLSATNLTNADLKYARVEYTKITDAAFTEANLYRVQFGGTILTSIDLSTAKGLIQTQHQGPSYIELHKVKLPQDGSVHSFLRGMGVPDEWIDFYRASMMNPIQYHSCFISYSSKDNMLARRLYADLQDHSVRCWFAPEDMKIGDKIRSRIDEAIHLQDKLLLLLSEQAIVSTWVEDEVEAAIEKEQRQQREVLFPIRLDESVMQTSQAWAAKLRRTRHIGDFTHWTDPQEYQQAFERLLRDLKVESNTEGETDGKPGAS